MNMMNYLFSCKCSDNFKSWMLTVLRVIVGLVFAAHGYEKLGMGADQVAGFFSSISIPLPLFFAYFITYLELIGGILLILGLLTHWISKLFSIEMLVAFLTVHAGKGVFVTEGGFELVALIFGAALVLMAFGPGKLALGKQFSN